MSQYTLYLVTHGAPPALSLNENGGGTDEEVDKHGVEAENKNRNDCMP